MRTSYSILCVLLAFLAVAAHAQSWFVESDYSGNACRNQTWLYISDVLDREQTTSCMSENPGSMYLSCDASFTTSPYSVYTFKDVSCATETNKVPVPAGYCLAGASSSLSISCQPKVQRWVPAAQLPSDTTLMAGYAYFSGDNCTTSEFYHTELRPVTTCSKISHESGRKANKCFAKSNNRSEIYLCGTVEIVLRTIDFNISTHAVLDDMTAAPVNTTTAPTNTAAPTDPTTAPTDPTTAPTDPTTAPTDPTTAPTDPTTAPTTAAPVQGGVSKQSTDHDYNSNNKWLLQQNTDIPNTPVFHLI